MADFPVLWLVVLFFLTFLGNGTLPLPITVYVLWLGQFDMPVPVVLIATAGTVTGWLFMGKHLSRLIPGSASTRLNRKIPGIYRQLFLKYPGWAVLVWNALPFPVDVSRVLALIQGISPASLAVPLALGRVIRYAILVTLGAIMASYNGFFWGLIALLVIPLVFKAFQKTDTTVSEVSEDYSYR